jgi:hypothetical protein
MNTVWCVCSVSVVLFLNGSAPAQCDYGITPGSAACVNTKTQQTTYVDITYCTWDGSGGSPDSFCSTSFGDCPPGTERAAGSPSVSNATIKPG